MLQAMWHVLNNQNALFQTRVVTEIWLFYMRLPLSQEAQVITECRHWLSNRGKMFLPAWHLCQSSEWSRAFHPARLASSYSSSPSATSDESIEFASTLTASVEPEVAQEVTVALSAESTGPWFPDLHRCRTASHRSSCTHSRQLRSARASRRPRDGPNMRRRESAARGHRRWRPSKHDCRVGIQRLISIRWQTQCGGESHRCDRGTRGLRLSREWRQGHSTFCARFRLWNMTKIVANLHFSSQTRNVTAYI